MENVSAKQINATRKELNNLHQKQATIFEQTDLVVIRYTDVLWQQLITEKKIDADWAKKEARKVDIDTIAHTNVREIGAEWICYNTWNKLKLTEFLQSKDWNDTQIKLAATQVISRAVYPASELKTSSWTG